MNDTYQEQIVAKKGNGLEIAIRIAIYLLLAFLFFLSILRPLFIVAVIALGAFAFYYLFPRLNVEYEYSCLNSEFSIDAIFSKSSRKHITGFDFKNVERLTRKESMDASRYPGAKVLDFTGVSDNLGNYALVIANPGQKKIVYLTLNNAMLNIAKLYVPKYGFEA